MSAESSLGEPGAIVGGPHNPQQIAAQRRLQQTQAQVDEVKGILEENVDKILNRDENLSRLEEVTDNIEEHASEFQQHATKLKNKFWLKNIKMIIILAVIALFVLIIIIVKVTPESIPQPKVTTTALTPAAATSTVAT